MVKLLPFIASVAILLGGCATAPVVDPNILRSVHYIADDWYLAAMNVDHDVFVHAKEGETQKVSHTHIYSPTHMRQSFASMKNWKVRVVNSGSSPICAKIKFLEVDYNINVEDGWVVMPPRTTDYVGELTQTPMFTVDRVISYDDAQWAVDMVTVVPYSNDTGCVVPKE